MNDKERANRIYRTTLVGSATNALLVALKLWAGIAGRSAAMFADAVHSLSDFATDLVVMCFVHISSKPVDKSHDYGHGKFETLATVIIGIALLVVGLSLFWGSTQSILFVINGGEIQRPGSFALIAAFVSIALKEILYRYTVHEARACNSTVMEANAWHHRSDAFSSIGTAVGIGGAYFLGNSWTVLDPIAALVVSIFIIRVALRLTRPALDELLEKSLPESVEKEIEEVVGSVEGVSQMHHLMTRRIGGNVAIEMHVRMDGNTPLYQAHEKATEIEHRLKAIFGERSHVGVHVEPMK
jgi:cation diffusion facilitator family transporter